MLKKSNAVNVGGIKSWSHSDRPREKFVKLGRRSLTDAELISILIRAGSGKETAVSLSKNLLRHFDDDLNKLAKADVSDLCSFKGIGLAKALSIIAALEIGRRRKNQKAETPNSINRSQHVYDVVFQNFADLLHEEFWVLILNRANKIQSQHRISVGGLSGTVADPKVIFKIALQQGASAIILAHNHPSGQLRPSEEDLNITKKLVEAGKLLEISVLDHLIVTDNGYFSFADEALI